MERGGIRLAIFDFDGTLTSGHLWRGISKHHHDRKIKRLALNYYLFSHIPFWLAARAGLYSEEKNRSRWGEDLSTLFKGFNESQAREAFIWVRDNYFAPLMRPDMLKLIQKHQSEGDKILLLSGMFQGFLEVVGEKLGIDLVVGTKMELKDGVYSGRIVRPLCFGENKARLLLESLQEKEVRVDFERSTSYADSYYDLPVFKLVGNPVAAYPDEKLLKFARTNNWLVVGG